MSAFGGKADIPEHCLSLNFWGVTLLAVVGLGFFLDLAGRDLGYLDGGTNHVGRALLAFRTLWHT